MTSAEPHKTQSEHLLTAQAEGVRTASEDSSPTTGHIPARHHPVTQPSEAQIRRWRRYLADEESEARIYRYLAQRAEGEEREILMQVAEAEKYDVILQEAVYVNPRLDITDKVIKALNAGK